ncbi:DUF6879 family protein [Kitasatospora sp. NPDC057692]|uniref:DUF6879 family protein n=1 Tax=Kitasatospora sp. NPDC057692 TaxID=3346215 RepID=UPI0036C6B183
MLLAGDAWEQCFDSMRSEAWRLETLPVYTMPQEAEKLARFLAGEHAPDDYESGWMAELRQWSAEGKTVGRVHLVTRPLSDYLRFEFEYYYRHHILAGEGIRILDVTDRENPLENVQDFWMFDRSKVVLMNYREDGTQISRELFGGDPAPYIEFQRIAVSESVPFLEYIGS